MDASTLMATAATTALLAVAGAVMLVARQRRQARDTATWAHTVERGQHIPASLHPVIDPDICIGSLSCLKACPEGDILGIVDGVAKLVEPSHCIGHGRCAAECPVGAIKLVFGTSERGVDLPEVDEFFESSRPGVHVVGELGGMGLIRNATIQGRQVAERLGQVMDRRQEPGVVDVVIVGSGPAGLATALGCRAAGLSFRVLEQETVGGTVANYPRHKLVMTEPVELPIIGKIGKRQISKEELLATWMKAVARADIRVEERTQVTGILGQDGDFTVETSQGPVRARKVVLATGRRGSPRKLGATGEALPKVSYRLIDPVQYEGSRVLVVGGGDAALEAAIQLAGETDAEVALSYRGDVFGKCRDANRKKVHELAERGRLTLLMKSQVREISPEQVVLELDGRRTELPNDFVIVCAGGELPLEFLKKVGVGLRRYHGEAPGEAANKPKVRRGSAKDDEARGDRRFAFALFTLGALIIAILAVVGWEYYALPRAERLKSPLHEALRPAGVWGHGVGIVATLFMLSNFLYAVRKRWSRLKGISSIRRWLTFHQFVGFMSPLVIAFHAAFQSNNHLATTTAGSLLVVVLTGIVGRFVYGLVPTQDGRALEYADVVARFERLKARLEPTLEQVSDPGAVRGLLALATAPAPRVWLPLLFLRMPFEAASIRLRITQARPLFPSAGDYQSFREDIFRLLRLRTQVGFYTSLKRLLGGWRVFHAVLAGFLVLILTAHILLSLYLGYRWVF
ncbi:NAD(P)-binding domain-containing protein [Myxococcus sp. RHSTA-1-4]|uniref:NAD(P)-binding domain-containing protein n=1 Tax=Myxococcus sp. RHSTA-1-4 TaxID=2874601 RepID=UPI001CBC9AF8|nr:NAD(P)-binding domain-containing protein [Myxococcus sp. RHSTA-1-4]MBZ4418603.1 NAD(P)-binding domain-containing protein [Myxococcus sp. RHSTA-1-4]